MNGETPASRPARWPKILGALVVLIIAAIVFGPQPRDLDELVRQIRSKYPDVSTIYPADLTRWLEDPQRTRPLLLDVRTGAEFAVSHLPEARRVGLRADVATALADVPIDREIVAYCSVGYRSSALAQRLQEAGYTQVRQLEGGIFRWANEGCPLVRDGQPARLVHPFNRDWERYLLPPLRATVDPVDEPMDLPWR